MTRLLEVGELAVSFRTDRGEVEALSGVTIGVNESEVVGASGCGKSLTAPAIMGLVPAPPGRITRGRIAFAGRDLLGLDAATMTRIRGKQIAMIFQEPMSALNPVLTIGEQVAEVLRVHAGRGGARAGGAAPGVRRHPRSGAAARAVSARALRGPAPARHDRRRACLPAETADRRRADHRA